MLMQTANARLQPLIYTQLHVDAARFATDDFNPFHDKYRWHQIVGNPFCGPLVLGFQLVALVEEAVRLHRLTHDEQTLLQRHALRYSNYQLNFAAAVIPGQTVQAEVKPSSLTLGTNPQLSNRVLLRADGIPAVLGFKRESAQPLLALPPPDFDVTALRAWPDRNYLPDGRTFLKRKYLMTGNGKTFLLGAGVEPTLYFDEMSGHVKFPQTFPLSYLSSALLERGLHDGHDFAAAPLVYVAHRYTVDGTRLATLASNDALHLLIGAPRVDSAGAASVQRHIYPCHMVLADGGVLCSAELVLAPLARLPAG